MNANDLEWASSCEAYKAAWNTRLQGQQHEAWIEQRKKEVLRSWHVQNEWRRYEDADGFPMHPLQREMCDKILGPALSHICHFVRSYYAEIVPLKLALSEDGDLSGLPLATPAIKLPADQIAAFLKIKLQVVEYLIKKDGVWFPVPLPETVTC